MIAEAQGDVEILGCCYFNFISDRLRRYKGNKPQDIDLDQVTKGSTAYDTGLLRAANAPILLQKIATY